MSNVPGDLKFTQSHEWVKIDDEGIATVGITDHAQNLLGELVYVELPEVGVDIHTGQEVGVVESVKAAADIYCPLSGEIVVVNDSLVQNPELINSDPYGDGWIYKIKPFDETDLETLLSADAYQELLDSEAH